ncbi:DUF2461 family protein, partial [Vibrio parahaemolyticus]
MTFTGFTVGASEFLSALADDNTKQFFDAHRREYEELIRQPLE